MNTTAIVNILFSLFISIGLCIIGFVVGGKQFMTFNERAQEYYVLNQSGAVAIFLFFVSITLGPIMLGYSFLYIVRFQMQNKLVYFGSLVMMDISLFIAIVAVAARFIGSEKYYYWYIGPDPQINTLEIFMAGLIVAIYTPLFLALTWSIFQAAYDIKVNNPATASFRPLQPKFEFKANVMTIIGILAIFVIFFFMTTALPPIWSLGTSLSAANQYFATDSAYSLIHGVLWYRKGIVHFVEQNVTTTNPTNGLPITTITQVPDPNWLQPKVYFKLYPDVVVFYCYLFVLMILGIASTYWVPLRRFLHRRIRVPDLPFIQWINIWPLGICWGEIFVVASMIVLHIFWFGYWIAWKYRDVSVTGPNRNIQIVSRAFGELSILAISFLVCPITRNNIWESVFGISFQRAIKYHRVLGVLAWVYATLHMLLFQGVWASEGTLANNAWLGVDNLLVTGHLDGDVDSNENWHPTNFTIPLMEFAWLLSVVALACAFWRLSIRYELFTLTHHAMLLFFTLSFLHSFQSWYFMGGGLLLYVCDKCIRFVNSSRYRTVQYLNYYQDARLVRLQVPGNSLGPHTFPAGSFCWICIPELSAGEWHPFSVTSAPYMAIGDRGVIEFTCLTHGPDSWTGQLAALAEKRAIEEITSHATSDDYSTGKNFDGPVHVPTIAPLVIGVDGPYGRCIDYASKHTLVMVAGGIGITMMLSIFAEIAARKRSPDQFGPFGSIKVVHLIWILRDGAMFSAFSHILDPIINDSTPRNMHLQVFETCSGNSFSRPLAEFSASRSGIQPIADGTGFELRGSSFASSHQGNGIDDNDLQRGGEDDGSFSTARDSSLWEARPSQIINSLHSNTAELVEKARYTEDGAGVKDPQGALSMSVGHALFQLQRGRPNLNEIFAEICSNSSVASQTSSATIGRTSERPSRASRVDRSRRDIDVATLVCGPKSLVMTVSELCYKYGFEFHSEEYAV